MKAGKRDVCLLYDDDILPQVLVRAAHAMLYEKFKVVCVLLIRS